MEQPTKTSSLKHIKNTSTGALKGLISSIPCIGAVLVGAWDGYQTSRLENTAEQLSIKIEKLGDEKIDVDFVQSEEFVDFFLKGVKIRLQHHSKQKAGFIYGMLVESMRTDRDMRFSTALKESFLSTLDQLSDEEMVFLYDFSNGKYKDKSQDDVYKIGNKESIALDGLLAKRILRSDSTWDQHIVESMLGGEFIAYLKLLATEDV